jgi:hypothetical protein
MIFEGLEKCIPCTDAMIFEGLEKCIPCTDASWCTTDGVVLIEFNANL